MARHHGRSHGGGIAALRLFIAAIVVTAGLVMLAPAGASAKDRLVWAEIDFPPFSIVDGPMKGMGLTDKTREYFVSRMPEFAHETAVFPILRVFQLMSAAENFCYPSAAKTAEREKAALFSRQIYWLKPIQLALRPADLQRFVPVLDATGAVDLARLFADPHLQGAVVLGRAYNPAVDRALSQWGKRASVFEVEDNTTLYRMMARGRIDWTFGYAEEGSYYLKLLGEDQRGTVTALPIAGSPRIAAGYFACSPGPIGERAINAINRIASEAGTPPAYFNHYAEWLSPDLFVGLRDEAFPEAAGR